MIKGLTSKISQILKKFVNIQEFNLLLNENYASLAWCLGFLINKTSLDDDTKNDLFLKLAEKNCKKIEEKFKEDEFFEGFAIESLEKQFENLKNEVFAMFYAIKNENVRDKLKKIFEESRFKESLKNHGKLVEKMKKTQNLNKKTFGKKTYLNEKNGNTSNLENLKKVLIKMTDELEETNKTIVEDLAEIEFDEIFSNKKEIKNSKINNDSEQPPAIKLFENHEKSTQTMKTKKLKIETYKNEESSQTDDKQSKEIQTQTIKNDSITDFQIAKDFITEQLKNIEKNELFNEKNTFENSKILNNKEIKNIEYDE